MNIVAADYGADGLRKAEELIPDLVLLDMLLPDMPEDAILARLYSNPATREIPVIILSGYCFSETDIEKLKKNGNLARVLGKPVKYDQLLRAAQEALSARLLPQAAATERAEKTSLDDPT